MTLAGWLRVDPSINTGSETNRRTTWLGVASSTSKRRRRRRRRGLEDTKLITMSTTSSSHREQRRAQGEIAPRQGRTPGKANSMVMRSQAGVSASSRAPQQSLILAIPSRERVCSPCSP